MSFRNNVPACDMTKDCPDAVTHIDSKGYIYCQTHGEERQSYQRCRKLKPNELLKLAKREPIDRF